MSLSVREGWFSLYRSFLFKILILFCKTNFQYTVGIGQVQAALTLISATITALKSRKPNDCCEITFKNKQLCRYLRNRACLVAHFDSECRSTLHSSFVKPNQINYISIKTTQPTSSSSIKPNQNNYLISFDT